MVSTLPSTLLKVNVNKIQCIGTVALLKSLFADIKEEWYHKASSTSSVLQIAIFTLCVCECAFVCTCVFSNTLWVKSLHDLWTLSTLNAGEIKQTLSKQGPYLNRHTQPFQEPEWLGPVARSSEQKTNQPDFNEFASVYFWKWTFDSKVQNNVDTFEQVCKKHKKAISALQIWHFRILKKINEKHKLLMQNLARCMLALLL